MAFSWVDNPPISVAEPEPGWGVWVASSVLHKDGTPVLKGDDTPVLVARRDSTQAGAAMALADAKALALGEVLAAGAL